MFTFFGQETLQGLLEILLEMWTKRNLKHEIFYIFIWDLIYFHINITTEF